MATIYGNTNKSVWTFKLVVSEDSTNVENNTSKVTVKAYIGRASDASSSYMKGAKISCAVRVTGCSDQTISYTNSGTVNVSSGGWLEIGSKTFDAVPHNDDGSKTVVVSASFTNNVSPQSGSASGNFVLTTIARASQPSCITWPEHTQNVGEFGDTIEIHMNRKSSSFTHTVRYAFGNSTGVIATGVTNYCYWTIPDSLMDLLPNHTSGTGTIYVDTYNWSTKIGTKSCWFTVTVPADVIPSCSLQVLDATDYKDTYGNLIKGLSKLYIKITGSGVHSSKITQYRLGIKYNGANEWYTFITGNEFTTGVLEYSGTVAVRVTAFDSRGRSSTLKEASFPVIDYERPKITSLDVHRCDEDGDEDENGDFVKATFSAVITPLNNKNSAVYKLRYTNNSTGAVTEVALSDITLNYTPSGYSKIFAASSDSSYTVEIVAKDDIAEIPLGRAVSTAFTLYNCHKSGTGWAFGKVAEEENTLENNLKLRQIKNRYAYQPSAFNGEKGYTVLAQINVTELNVNAPIVFVINRRGALCPMTVYVRFESSSTSTDPALGSITYDGDNYGVFLVKVGTSIWKLYVDNTSGWSNPCVQDWYTTDNQNTRMSVTFPSEQVAGTGTDVLREQSVEEDGGKFYRAIPARMRSILDFIYPVGSIYLSYSHVDPATMFGGTWERLQNAFLWAVDESGIIGQTGGEKTHTLTASEMPKHSHDVSVANLETGSTSASNKVRYGNSNTSYIGALATLTAGGGEAHNNMPPYIQVSAWRRTA